MTLVEFLTARLDEDEAAAKASVGSRWHAQGWSELRTEPADEPAWQLIARGGEGDTRSSFAHIARHDPARVLAGVEAKRRIAAEHQRSDHSSDAYLDPECGTCGTALEYPVAWPCPTLRLLALPYADHPDYDEAWRS